MSVSGSSRLPNHKTKFVFITGGVVSSLGKGIVAASLGALMESRGLKIAISKADPYINIDPGTMSPYQHGEVFVTEDGAETDLDLGHYERFTKCKISKKNSFTSGQIYDEVLSQERKGEYLGLTVQVVPHVTQKIRDRIMEASQNVDLSIVEIGGTVGDIEIQPYIESIRQIRYEWGSENVFCIHLTLVPYIAAARELKTKPTQHSVKELRALGIQPDLLVCRSEHSIPLELREKIAVLCSLPTNHVIEGSDVDSIYRLPLIFHRQGLDSIVLERLGMWTGQPHLEAWERVNEGLSRRENRGKLAIIGKYTHVADAYKSLSEALEHGSLHHKVKLDITYVDSQELETMEESSLENFLGSFHGILVPGGFGNRGIDGKMRAVSYARRHGTPFLGICLGMQLACLEFARNVLGWSESQSEEFSSSEPQIIHFLEGQETLRTKGGTMRLGAYPCDIVKDTLALKIYAETRIWERHRHRYEFNELYQKDFEEKGMVFSGFCPEGALVEMVEIRDHPWFLGCQFHPELQSRPTAAHPVFVSFVEAILGAASLP